MTKHQINEDRVLLKLKFNGKQLNFTSANFFEALEKLRKYLDEKQIQILCNGAALNVYPSLMSRLMGMEGGLTNYVMEGKQ
ncbi:hypothetical protein [Cytobacillus purgationiresistens]|uniref:STAS domain-containing protein n=1 Tax=Cytobacillus purgationiresistens TaxID=863449 RepID=A0ABU0AM02_9BACI|nr:hypothetical protein [Cytobacillus purgationiresistens]MDQ0272290.1 hypothetical protein [Cytobacillus purgationiresistens]